MNDCLWSDAPQDVKTDLENGFVMTDVDDNYQRCKQLSFSTFQYKQGSDTTCDLVDESIDVNDLTSEQKSDAISGYYGTLEKLSEECDNDQESINMLIAECYFETELC